MRTNLIRSSSLYVIVGNNGILEKPRLEGIGKWESSLCCSSFPSWNEGVADAQTDDDLSNRRLKRTKPAESVRCTRGKRKYDYTPPATSTRTPPTPKLLRLGEMKKDGTRGIRTVLPPAAVVCVFTCMFVVTASFSLSLSLSQTIHRLIDRSNRRPH